MAGRFIKLYDKLLSWEWHNHPNTLSLFIHLLLKANYKDQSFQGTVIRRGQLVTSLPKLSTDVGLSIQQTRTALSHLISTGEVTDESNTQYRIITIVKYDEYQTSTGKSTDDQQTINRRSNRQSTDDLTPSIEYIEQIESNRRIESLSKRERGSAKRFVPPSRKEVNDFCLEAGIEIDVERFVDYYTSKGWMVGKSPMKDWKAAVRGWAARESKNSAPPPRPAPAPKKIMAQDYDQRDYSGIDERIKRDMERRIMEMRRRNNGEA